MVTNSQIQWIMTTVIFFCYVSATVDELPCNISKPHHSSKVKGSIAVYPSCSNTCIALKQKSNEYFSLYYVDKIYYDDNQSNCIILLKKNAACI